MKAVYAGSFDPFTNGHLDILNQSKLIFDNITILICKNPLKTRRVKIDNVKHAIIKSVDVENVIEYEGLVAEYCKENNIEFLIRGLRNTSDYLYEENIAKINQEINNNLKTIYFRADNEVISSTMIWELFNYGKDISKYIPEIMNVMMK